MSIDRGLSVLVHQTNRERANARRARGGFDHKVEDIRLSASTRGIQAVARNPFGQCEYYRVNHLEDEEKGKKHSPKVGQRTE